MMAARRDGEPEAGGVNIPGSEFTGTMPASDVDDHWIVAAAPGTSTGT